MSKITAVHPTDSSKIQLEIRDRVKRPGQSALSRFNADDERFSTNKEQVAWLTASPAIAQKLFPNLKEEIQKAAQLNKKETNREDFYLDNAVPGVFHQDGRVEVLGIQITESTSAQDDWDVKNLDRALKQDGDDNYTVTKDGFGIFQKKDVILGEPQHTFLKHDRLTPNLEEIKYIYEGITYQGTGGNIVEADEKFAKELVPEEKQEVEEEPAF